MKPSTAPAPPATLTGDEEFRESPQTRHLRRPPAAAPGSHVSPETFVVAQRDSDPRQAQRQDEQDEASSASVATSQSKHRHGSRARAYRPQYPLSSWATAPGCSSWRAPSSCAFVVRGVTATVAADQLLHTRSSRSDPGSPPSIPLGLVRTAPPHWLRQHHSEL